MRNKILCYIVIVFVIFLCIFIKARPSNSFHVVNSAKEENMAVNSQIDSTENGDYSQNFSGSNGTQKTDSIDNSSSVATTDSLISSLQNQAKEASVIEDEYPYDIDKDRALFKNKKVDIKVGDKFYMTQINDWYINFKDYEGKVVEIEGKYIRIGNYDFIGRSGPTCPYCTGGYVDFEFKTNESLKDIESEQSWLKIIGILRKGKSHMSDGKNQDFYYIETMSLEKMDKAGIDPITD